MFVCFTAQGLDPSLATYECVPGGKAGMAGPEGMPYYSELF